MEIPKNYSCEDLPPVPAARASSKKLDGEFVQRRHREVGGIDPNELVYKLQNLSKEYAIDSLKQHYHSVFLNRRRPRYNVYITYYNAGQQQNLTYLVRVDKNTPREVKKKLPIKGQFRLFFIRNGKEAEEFDDDNSELPYQVQGEDFKIYCRVSPK